MQKLKILSTILLILFLSTACTTFKEAAPKEKALIIATELSNFYLDTRSTYLKALPDLDESKQEYMKEKVAPKLNTIQDMLVLYNQSVIMWNKTDQYPNELDQLAADIRNLLIDVIMLIGNISGGGKE